MELKINKYNLPDIDILYNYSDDRRYIFWIPDKVYVILGVSNKPEDSLIIDNILKDEIEVFKRLSGGETVVLTPNTLVISAIRISDVIPKMSPKEVFKLYNSKIIYSLESFGIKNLYQKGISDISINDKKILGSAIYRSKDKIFYQAVLNISENPELFERYLKHPKREPDYRKGRGHSDFVTSIFREGYNIDINSIIESLELCFK